LNAHYTDPDVVAGMWAVATNLGFVVGKFVEPGCGRGNFIAHAPVDMSGWGVELDPTTARVASLLHERHHIVNDDFALLDVGRSSVDVAIGNVPFADVGLYDPVFNPHRRVSMHDHFVAKAGAMLRPGGLGLLITSHFSFDALSTSGRALIGEYADVVGLVRLPAGAQRAEAGTDVVTDVVVLRGRSPGAPSHHAATVMETCEIATWMGTALHEPVRINAYLRAHPECVLGTVCAVSTPYGYGLGVRGDLENLGTRIHTTISELYLEGFSPRPPEGERPQVFVQSRTTNALGRIERRNGRFERCGVDGWEPFDPGKEASQLTLLLALRDQVRAIVEIEADAEAPEALIDARRRELRETYETYKRSYGYLNAVRVNPNTGRRVLPRLGGFRTDPDWPRVSALEIYDETTNTARPAALLEHRVVNGAHVVEHVESAEDALSLSLQERGRIDLDFIEHVTDRPALTVIRDLGERVYKVPETGQWVSAEEYLSGNVRKKLAVAQAKLEDTLDGSAGEFQRNVAALQAAQPPPVLPSDISGLLSAGWVPAELISSWVETWVGNWNGRPPSVAYTTREATWTVHASTAFRQRIGLGHRYGGRAFTGIDVLKAALAGRAPQITHTVEGTRVVNADETAQAAERLVLMKEDFDHWMLRDDPARTDMVMELYNDRFNAWVPRSYAGITISAAGLRSDFELRPHQHQAIARIVYGGNALLAHPVGAGKTAEMIVGAMERKRLGLCERPCFVVPNHLLAQFARDVVDLYPSVDVLVIDKDDMSPSKRALFAAKVRSHAWDAVVITQSSFSRWPLSHTAAEAILNTRLTEAREALSAASHDDESSPAEKTRTKQIEKRVLTAEQRIIAAREELRRNQDTYDLPFDAAGIDYLCIDEAHEYKNGELTTQARNLRGVPVGPGSQRAQDLLDKITVLRTQHPGRAVVTLATGTPVTNTVAELWIMARYVAPDLLEETGMTGFDAFRAQFCETETGMELDVSGTTLRNVERLSKYKNLPELARWMGEWADIVTVEQMALPRPELAGGERMVVIIPPAREMTDFMTREAAARADAIRSGRVPPEEDNLLKLCSDCRLAAFDWESFRGEPVAPEHSPLVAAADRIAAIYHEHKDRRYLSAGGHVHPTPGAFQLVFSDLGIPKAGRPSAYDRLREALTERGVPRTKIAFAHEHDESDDAKQRLFEGCRTGRYAVVVTSTPKMGQGTNVQDRMIALHHLSVPWRPADVEQREGRLLRQGNQNQEVQIFAYATERSFASFGWQTLERKAGFIGQVLRADPEGPRSVEHADSEVLSYGEIKAISTGDPDFLKLAEIEEQVGKLERLDRAFERDRQSAARRATSLARTVAVDENQLHTLRRIRDAAPPGAPVTLSVRGRAGERSTLARHVADLIHADGRLTLRVENRTLTFNFYPTYGPEKKTSIGTFSGPYELNLRFKLATTEVASILGVFTRIENWVGRIPAQVEELETKLALDAAEKAALDEQANTPSPYRDELVTKRDEKTSIEAALAERYKEQPSTEPEIADERAVVPSPLTAIEPGNALYNVLYTQRTSGATRGLEPG
jgi:N12 class adenine-specific DNA methylase